MGRRSGGGGRRAAPRRAASSTARRPVARPPARSAPAPKPPARSAATQAAPPAKAAPAAAPAPAQTGSGMGGFMANVASTGLGVAAGRAIDRTLFGGGGGGGGQETMHEEVPLEAGSEYLDDSNKPEMTDEMCSREVSEFKKCLARTGTDMQACKWNLDILMACQQQQASTGFADAGRF